MPYGSICHRLGRRHHWGSGAFAPVAPFFWVGGTLVFNQSKLADGAPWLSVWHPYVFMFKMGWCFFPVVLVALLRQPYLFGLAVQQWFLRRHPRVQSFIMGQWCPLVGLAALTVLSRAGTPLHWVGGTQLAHVCKTWCNPFSGALAALWTSDRYGL